MNNEERKQWASKHNSNALKNAADDEPVFVLRGKDFSAPGTIVNWIGANILTAPEDKLRDALECALAMRSYPNALKKQAD